MQGRIFRAGSTYLVISERLETLLPTPWTVGSQEKRRWREVLTIQRHVNGDFPQMTLAGLRTGGIFPLRLNRHHVGGGTYLQWARNVSEDDSGGCGKKHPLRAEIRSHLATFSACLVRADFASTSLLHTASNNQIVEASGHLKSSLKRINEQRKRARTLESPDSEQQNDYPQSRL